MDCLDQCRQFASWEPTSTSGAPLSMKITSARVSAACARCIRPQPAILFSWQPTSTSGAPLWMKMTGAGRTTPVPQSYFRSRVIGDESGHHLSGHFERYWLGHMTESSPKSLVAPVYVYARNSSRRSGRAHADRPIDSLDRSMPSLPSAGIRRRIGARGRAPWQGAAPLGRAAVDRAEGRQQGMCGRVERICAVLLVVNSRDNRYGTGIADECDCAVARLMSRRMGASDASTIFTPLEFMLLLRGAFRAPLCFLLSEDETNGRPSVGIRCRTSSRGLARRRPYSGKAFASHCSTLVF